MSQMIYYIRHGTATHNVDSSGEKCYVFEKHTDSKLTKKGENEAKELGKIWKKKNTVDLVIVSPLTRAITTCLHIFGDCDKKIICLETIRETTCGVHTPNKRKTRTELQKLYPSIDFSRLVSDKDTWWKPNEFEKEEFLNKRLNEFKEFVEKRKEKTIAVVAHNSVLSQLFFGKVFHERISHCHPYFIDKDSKKPEKVYLTDY